MSWEIDYKVRLEQYRKHVENLKEEKKRFVENNPSFPKDVLDIMFLNVIAPPQRIEIITIK